MADLMVNDLNLKTLFISCFLDIFFKHPIFMIPNLVFIAICLSPSQSYRYVVVKCNCVIMLIVSFSQTYKPGFLRGNEREDILFFLSRWPKMWEFSMISIGRFHGSLTSFTYHEINLYHRFIVVYDFFLSIVP